MGLIRWFSKNWADTVEPTHPDLAPLQLDGTVADAVARVKAAAAGLRGWALHSEAHDVLHFVRRTRVLRFADDVRVRFHIGADGVRVDAESRSRVGKGDLGQNRRNIRELWAAVSRPAPAGRG
jgi:uncharacterized protein (DUF1499 family)